MRTKTILIGLFVIVTVSLYGCAKQETQEIKIGAILPLTGDIASYGKRAQKGIEIALEEINGSVQYHMKIAVDFQDGRGNAKESVTLMKKFCSINKYPVVIGAAASSVSLAMVPIANQYKILQISPISSSPALTTKGGKYFFRVCPSDAFQAVILAEWMRELKIESVGILFVNNSWGISLQDRFVEEFKARGGKIATVESCKDGDRDFRTQLSKIIASEPDALYSPTYGKEGGIILKQTKELGFKKKIFGSDVWSSPELLTSAGDAANGVFLVKPAEYKGDAYQAFRDKYFAKYNEEPDVYAAYSYDVSMILARAFAAGKTAGPELCEYLLTMPAYDGVTGVTQFDDNGDCNTKAFIRQQIQDNKYIEIAMHQ
ncbi:MAG: ABC transporter substrate-binding protein [Deltaproteobacteria bacterium]|nr:ABC transporter substrate-binding protein [Deltaproteobacteria bacterium]